MLLNQLNIINEYWSRIFGPPAVHAVIIGICLSGCCGLISGKRRTYCDVYRAVVGTTPLEYERSAHFIQPPNIDVKKGGETNELVHLDWLADPNVQAGSP